MIILLSMLKKSDVNNNSIIMALITLKRIIVIITGISKIVKLSYLIQINSYK
jgi:hypothetical protein